MALGGRSDDAYAPVSLSEKLVVDVPLENDDEAISEAWRVLSDFRLDALRDAEPLSEIIVERIVAQEFRRPDSAVISALRSAVKSRVGHRVSAESVVAALARMMDSTQLPREKRRGQRDAPPLTPGRKAALTRRLNREKEGEQITDRGGLRDLVDAGLLPPDAMLEMTWKGNRYTGHLRSGQIEVDGRLFSSPSAAGAYVRKGSATNGWKWWRYRDELLWSLRERLRTRR